MILHGYWRSGTSYRTRIALALKGITYEQASVDLRAGGQHSPAFRALNPQGLVPAIETDDGQVLTQSPAILEWLEEAYPHPPLLPVSAADRAIVRAMAATVACDIHPLNNLRVLQAVRALGADSEAIDTWTARWIGAGFAALEDQIARHGRGFAYGDAPTLADCHLVPQVYSAERFRVDLGRFPRLMAAVTHARAHPAFVAAHPDRQPDADA
ncbi:MAG: maiA [Sphingomonas bacterium]|uniref:maleylacetoacetate isomerase n=1 Tax=Sphingomonas bacterium TaxID=1895847 RepID=UPI002613AD55|nr:maleylacetoacetate isomerase [Sphingomonas bacterium]MDB5696010.1 maiA [Sphingomonas bacterium]